jgi:hypothetical protein
MRTLGIVMSLMFALLSPAKAEPTFLEAALFFLTDVETSNQDYVTETEIRLRRWPIVAYLVEDAPCVVRLRNTNYDRLWQFDFCKITEARWTRAVALIGIGTASALFATAPGAETRNIPKPTSPRLPPDATAKHY